MQRVPYFSKLCALTLVELLGAISIAMVLTSVGMYAMNGIKAASEEARAQNNIRVLNEAIERFAARGGNPVVAAEAGGGVYGDPTPLINTLRSSHPDMLAMGGPFLDSAKEPMVAESVGSGSPDAGKAEWMAVMNMKSFVQREIKNAAGAVISREDDPPVVFFELMSPKGEVKERANDGSTTWVAQGTGRKGITGFKVGVVPGNFEPLGTLKASSGNRTMSAGSPGTMGLGSPMGTSPNQWSSPSPAHSTGHFWKVSPP